MTSTALTVPSFQTGNKGLLRNLLKFVMGFVNDSVVMQPNHLDHAGRNPVLDTCIGDP